MKINKRSSPTSDSLISYTNYNTREKHNMVDLNGMKSFKELGIIAIARSGQDVVSHYVTNGAPGQNIYNVEANRVIRFEEAHILLGSGVSCLKMGYSILLRQALLGHILSLEVEEHKPPQEK